MPICAKFTGASLGLTYVEDFIEFTANFDAVFDRLVHFKIGWSATWLGNIAGYSAK